IKIVRKRLGSYQDAVARFRRDLIERSLAQADGNQNQAAAMLKISRQALACQIVASRLPDESPESPLVAGSGGGGGVRALLRRFHLSPDLRSDKHRAWR